MNFFASAPLSPESPRLRSARFRRDPPSDSTASTSSSAPPTVSAMFISDPFSRCLRARPNSSSKCDRITRNRGARAANESMFEMSICLSPAAISRERTFWVFRTASKFSSSKSWTTFLPLSSTPSLRTALAVLRAALAAISSASTRDVASNTNSRSPLPWRRSISLTSSSSSLSATSPCDAGTVSKPSRSAAHSSSAAASIPSTWPGSWSAQPPSRRSACWHLASNSPNALLATSWACGAKFRAASNVAHTCIRALSTRRRVLAAASGVVAAFAAIPA
mmetsp:Transcript_7730/g.21120  ORF Transcript_7730/g.21120 Transcript_7730/m.21120 type:complete len:278 (+) Transcript_7730:1915-2748(+)